MTAPAGHAYLGTARAVCQLCSHPKTIHGNLVDTPGNIDYAMGMTNTTYQVRITSATGLSRTIDSSRREADRDARNFSLRADTIEADILVNGEFHTAYINGVRVLAYPT